MLSVPWTLVALSDGDRRVTVRYDVAGCTELSHVIIHQTKTSVVVEVLLDDHRAGRLCPAYTTSRLAIVRLALPLGSRALIHARSAG